MTDDFKLVKHKVPGAAAREDAAFDPHGYQTDGAGHHVVCRRARAPWGRIPCRRRATRAGTRMATRSTSGD